MFNAWLKILCAIVVAAFILVKPSWGASTKGKRSSISISRLVNACKSTAFTVGLRAHPNLRVGEMYDGSIDELLEKLRAAIAVSKNEWGERIGLLRISSSAAILVTKKGIIRLNYLRDEFSNSKMLYSPDQPIKDAKDHIGIRQYLSLRLFQMGTRAPGLLEIISRHIESSKSDSVITYFADREAWKNIERELGTEIGKPIVIKHDPHKARECRFVGSLGVTFLSLALSMALFSYWETLSLVQLRSTPVTTWSASHIRKANFFLHWGGKYSQSSIVEFLKEDLTSPAAISIFGSALDSKDSTERENAIKEIAHALHSNYSLRLSQKTPIAPELVNKLIKLIRRSEKGDSWNTRFFLYSAFEDIDPKLWADDLKLLLAKKVCTEPGATIAQKLLGQASQNLEWPEEVWKEFLLHIDSAPHAAALHSLAASIQNWPDSYFSKVFLALDQPESRRRAMKSLLSRKTLTPLAWQEIERRVSGPQPDVELLIQLRQNRWGKPSSP